MSNDENRQAPSWENGDPAPAQRTGPPPAEIPSTAPDAPVAAPANGVPSGPGVFGYTNSRATRHLCAGTYLDDDFQRRVLDEVYNEPRRAVAPAAGCDAASVALHARYARNLDIWQSAILLGLMTLFACVAYAETLMVAYILYAWQITVAQVRLIVDTIAFVKGKGTQTLGRLAARFMLIIVAMLVAGLVMITLGGTMILDSLFGGRTSSGFGGSTGTGWDNDFGDSDPAFVPVLFLFLLLATIITVVTFAVIRRLRVLRLRRDVGDTGIRDTARSQRIRVGQHGDVVTYSGYSPFIGHGTQLWTWQFALPLYPRPGGPDRDIAADGPGFTVPQLIYAIHSGLYRYIDDQPGFKRLPNLVIGDQAFVAGLDLRHPAHFAAELPHSGLPADITDIKNDPTLPVRHFLKCQINSWDGELVTTIFVTAAIQGETLYMEFNSHVLPPTKAEYHVLEDASQTSGFAVFLDAVKAVGRLPITLGRSPVVLIRALRDLIRAATRDGGLPEEIVGRQDHGAKVSVRELGTDLDVHNYFQEHDSVKYTSILQTQILEHTVNFLERFIDVSELRQRKDTIVNNTVVNQGTVYTASQTGPGFVGAQGNRAQGTATQKGH